MSATGSTIVSTDRGDDRLDRVGDGRHDRVDYGLDRIDDRGDDWIDCVGDGCDDGVGAFRDGLDRLCDGVDGFCDRLSGFRDGLDGLCDRLGGFRDGLDRLCDGLDGFCDRLGGFRDGLDRLCDGLDGFCDRLGDRLDHLGDRLGGSAGGRWYQVEGGGAPDPAEEHEGGDENRPGRSACVVELRFAPSSHDSDLLSWLLAATAAAGPTAHRARPMLSNKGYTENLRS